jgi:sulfite reductase (NADPH) hemoprotein beta-component
MAQIVIASDLGSGRVVFLAKGSTEGAVSWGGLIETSEVAADDALADALLAMAEADAAARHEVVDPYLIDVEEEGGALRPTKYREAIRCLGPTNRPDLGKQAEGAEA